MPEPMIIADPGLSTPSERPYWTTPEMYDINPRAPYFRVSEVAKMFFGMSPGWVRKYMGLGYEVDGEPFVPLRSSAGYNVWRLCDIERWAHALAENRVISGQQLELTVGVVRLVARMHQLISWEHK